MSVESFKKQIEILAKYRKSSFVNNGDLNVLEEYEKRGLVIVFLCQEGRDRIIMKAKLTDIGREFVERELRMIKGPKRV